MQEDHLRDTHWKRPGTLSLGVQVATAEVQDDEYNGRVEQGDDL